MDATLAIPVHLTAKADAAARAARTAQIALAGYATEAGLRRADAEAKQAIEDLFELRFGLTRLIADMETGQ